MASRTEGAGEGALRFAKDASSELEELADGMFAMPEGREPIDPRIEGDLATLEREVDERDQEENRPAPGEQGFMGTDDVSHSAGEMPTREDLDEATEQAEGLLERSPEYEQKLRKAQERIDRLEQQIAEKNQAPQQEQKPYTGRDLVKEYAEITGKQINFDNAEDDKAAGYLELGEFGMFLARKIAAAMRPEIEEAKTIAEKMWSHQRLSDARARVGGLTQQVEDAIRETYPGLKALEAQDPEQYAIIARALAAGANGQRSQTPGREPQTSRRLSESPAMHVPGGRQSTPRVSKEAAFNSTILDKINQASSDNDMRLIETALDRRYGGRFPGLFR